MCAHTLCNVCTLWDSITARFFLAAHGRCACTEDALVNSQPHTQKVS